MYIYQIGSVIVRGYSNLDSPLSFKSSSFQDSFGNLQFTDIYKSPEPVNISISGELTVWNEQSPNRQLQKLISIAGMPYIDIIGFMPKDCAKPYQYTDCDDCFEGVRWFHTYGQIIDINRTYTFSDSDDPEIRMELSLEVEINPFWTRLNEYLWFVKYGTDKELIFTDLQGYTTPLSRNTFPSEVLPFNFEPSFEFFKYVLSETDKDEFIVSPTDYWTAWTSDNNDFVAETGLTLATNDVFNVYNIYQYDIDSLYYIYFGATAFSGTITFDVESEISPYKVFSYTTEITTSGLVNGAAASNLNSTYLFFGSNIDPFLYTISSGTIKSTYDSNKVHIPYIDHNSPKPLQMVGTNNKITVTVSGSNTATFGYIHKYRYI